MEFDELTKGYAERYSRRALFEPFDRLRRKQLKDENGKTLDYEGIGLLCLLYFFEQKLIRNPRAGVKEFAVFLKNKASSVYSFTPDKWELISRTVINEFRPPSGKKFTVPYFNWDSLEDESLTFSFFKASSFDIATNTQYYMLDDSGLELVFATKEFYSEFQLSINQLLLRKQLEKGEFKGALRQLNEMRMDVESLEERNVRLTQELKRNITSEETFQRYARLIDDMLLRLSLEHDEFQALQLFVKETKEALHMHHHTKKEKEAYTLILQISTGLEEVHHQHTNLLNSCTTLKTNALRAAQEALYFVGIDSFNFDQDITSRIISTPLPMESMKGLLAPFLTLEQVRTWSPLTLFAPQQVRGKREEKEQQDFLEADETGDTEYRHLLRTHYTFVFRLLLDFIGEEGTVTLEQFTDHLLSTEQSELASARIYYDFFLLLHQRSPIVQETEAGADEAHLLDGVRQLLETRALTIQELPEIIQPHSRFAIQNMKLSIKEVGDDAI